MRYFCYEEAGMVRDETGIVTIVECTNGIYHNCHQISLNYFQLKVKVNLVLFCTGYEVKVTSQYTAYLLLIITAYHS